MVSNRPLCFLTVYPGEMEQETLALAVLEALRGEREIREYSGKPVWDGFEWAEEQKP